MEISLREWLVIGGVVVIALIIFDGWRRVRGGRNSLRMDIDRRFREQPDEPAEQSSNPELPFGGARRAGSTAAPDPAGKVTATATRSAAPAAQKSAARPAQDRIEPTFGDSVASETRQRPPQPAVQQFSARDLEPEVSDHFMDPDTPAPAFEALSEDDWGDDEVGKPRTSVVRPAESGNARYQSREPVADMKPEPVSQQPSSGGPFAPTRLEEIDPLFDELPDDFPEEPQAMPEPVAVTPEPEIEPKPEPKPEPKSKTEPEPHTGAIDLEKPVPMLMERTRKPRDGAIAETREPPMPVQPPEMPLEDELPPAQEPAAKPSATEAPQQDSLFAEPEPSGQPKSAPAASRSAAEPADPENVLVIIVVSKDEEAGFPGVGIRRILEACDLNLGDLNIFHRHEDGTGSGPVQFSMANAVNPGTFDAKTIDSIHTPGVTFFMSMEEPRDVMNAFECMLATAETLARHLNGDLLDENRSVLRPQTKEHYRQRIRDYEMHNRSRRSASRA